MRTKTQGTKPFVVNTLERTVFLVTACLYWWARVRCSVAFPVRRQTARLTFSTAEPAVPTHCFLSLVSASMSGFFVSMFVVKYDVYTERTSAATLISTVLLVVTIGLSIALVNG
jgi:hypothetical protein